MSEEEDKVQSESVPEGEAVSAPENLEEAMSALREQNADTAEGDLEGQQNLQQDDGAVSESGQTAQTSQEPNAGEVVETVQSGDEFQRGEFDSGSAVVAETSYQNDTAIQNNEQRSSDDYAAARQAILEGITRQASQEATKEFKDHGVEKFNIGSLYEKDERSGRVVFNNPDDPDHPFTSRAEAQNWIDSMNAQIDAEWQRSARAKQNEYAQSMMPTIALLDFAPTYEQLTPSVKNTMDKLIEPYSVYDSAGRVIGFNCDLEAAARQAIQIDQSYSSAAPRTKAASQKKAEPAGGPATDMKTKRSPSSAKSGEPKDLEEAMKMYNESQKKGKKK